MADALTLNAVGISTWKASVSAKPNWMEQPAAQVDEQLLASGLGSVLGDPLVGSRALTFSLLIRGTSESDMRTQVRALTTFCYLRELTLVQSISTARQITGLCVRITEKQVGARDLMRGVELTFTLTCEDPRWRTTTLTTQTGISTTPVAITLGGARVDDWTGTFHGASTDAFATLKNGAGVTLAVFGWVGTLSGGQQLDLDAREWMTRKSGLLTPMNTWYGGYPTFDPADAPTIQISSGTLDLSFAQADWQY